MCVCGYLSGPIYKIYHRFLLRVEFTLDEQYDLVWHLPAGAQRIPLFQTTSFDVTQYEIELMGGWDGRSFLFEVCMLCVDVCGLHIIYDYIM